MVDVDTEPVPWLTAKAGPWDQDAEKESRPEVRVLGPRLNNTLTSHVTLANNISWTAASVSLFVS